MSDKSIDAGLVESFKSGDLKSFEELVSRYSHRVYNLAFRISRNEEDSQDIMQEVFITVFTKIQSFQGKSAFSSWLYRITANAAFMRLRKRKSTFVVCLDEESENVLENLPSPDDESMDLGDRLELRDAVETALKNLPDDYRAIFVLRDIDKLSNEAVAAVLGLSVPAVKSRLHRSRSTLRKKLLGLHQDESEPVEEAA
jgi:RNA polymerase sigma-70 factor, ECF subfamily